MTGPESGRLASRPRVRPSCLSTEQGACRARVEWVGRKWLGLRLTTWESPAGAGKTGAVTSSGPAIACCAVSEPAPECRDGRDPERLPAPRADRDHRERRGPLVPDRGGI